MHGVVSEHFEVGHFVEFFCEDCWHIEFHTNAEDIYLFHVDAFPDVVLTEAELLHTFWCVVFKPIYTCMVVVVAFGWKVEVDVL